jgi:hypothetical protein
MVALLANRVLPRWRLENAVVCLLFHPLEKRHRQGECQDIVPEALAHNLPAIDAQHTQHRLGRRQVGLGVGESSDAVAVRTLDSAQLRFPCLPSLLAASRTRLLF